MGRIQKIRMSGRTPRNLNLISKLFHSRLNFYKIKQKCVRHNNGKKAYCSVIWTRINHAMEYAKK